MDRSAVVKAIEAAGGRDNLARAIGVTGGAISQWGRVPVDKLAAVAAATGIPARELRPDLAEVFKADNDETQPPPEAA